MGSVDLSVLVNQWHGAIYNAFVFATGESPEATRRPGPRSSGCRRHGCRRAGCSWRNAAYALQWWIFALFAAYMWWRMVRDDHAGPIRHRRQPPR